MPRRVVSLLAFALPTILHAQQRCTDPLAGASWRLTPLTVAVTTPGAGDRDRDRYVESVLSAFGRGYFDPGAAQITSTSGMVVAGTVADPGIRDPIHATLDLAIDRNGRALDARMVARSGKPALDTALMRAATAAGGPTGYGKVPRKLRGDTLHFLLQVDDRGAPSDARAFGALSSPYLQADVAPVIRRMPPARAPAGHHRKRVVLAGTVGADGRVVAPTIRVVSSEDSVLTPIARASFEHTLFRPGTKHGCPAEATIRQVFPFP
jgi:hypothetical protein